jgi:hypothetical protein
MWELQHLTTSMSVRKENKGFPEAVFRAFYTAVTAWHVTDWLWQSRAETREIFGSPDSYKGLGGGRA